MIGLLCFVLAVIASPLKSKLRLEAENAVLRHQLIVRSSGRSGHAVRGRSCRLLTRPSYSRLLALTQLTTQAAWICVQNGPPHSPPTMQNRLSGRLRRLSRPPLRGGLLTPPVSD